MLADGLMTKFPKPDVMVALHVGAWVTLALILLHRGTECVAHLTWLDLTCLLIIAGCVQTVWVRLGHTMRRLVAEQSTQAGK